MGELSTGKQIEEQNGLIDCIKTVSGIFPTIGDAAKAFDKHDGSTNDKILKDIYSLAKAASTIEEDCKGLI